MIPCQSSYLNGGFNTHPQLGWIDVSLSHFYLCLFLPFSKINKHIGSIQVSVVFFQLVQRNSPDPWAQTPALYHLNSGPCLQGPTLPGEHFHWISRIMTPTHSHIYGLRLHPSIQTPRAQAHQLTLPLAVHTLCDHLPPYNFTSGFTLLALTPSPSCTKEPPLLLDSILHPSTRFQAHMAAAHRVFPFTAVWNF